MAQRPHELVNVLLDGHRAGLISRRRIMALATKLPALAAALAAGTRLQASGARATGLPDAASPRVRF